MEIRKVKTQTGEGLQYYVHFINCATHTNDACARIVFSYAGDKRLDEWVTIDCFDLDSIDEVTRYVATLNPLRLEN